MKTFLQSAIDCFEDKNSTWQRKHITTNEQFRYIRENEDYDACSASNESSMYLLLFLAAERGEL